MLGKRKRPTLKRRNQTVSAMRKRRRVVHVPRNRLNFPQSMKTQLRYTERIEFSPTGTGVNQYQFVGNGLYDPNLTGTGHQPRGFDQFMDVYKRFTVLGSTCTVQFMYEGYDGPSLAASAGNLTQNRGTTSNVPALTPVAVGLHKALDDLSAGTYIQQMEKDRTSWGYITGSSGQPCTLTMNGTTKEMFGKKFVVGSEGYTGTDAANPTDTWRWQIWAGRVSDDYPQELVKVVANVVIAYDCQFTEPKTLSES